MNNDATFDKIEAWLSGELPEAEARAFEAEMAADATLAAQVENHRKGQIALDRLAEQSLQQDFTRWRDAMDDIPPPPETGGGGKSWRWVVAGALFMLMTGAIWLLTTDSEKKTEILPAPPIVPVTEGKSDHASNQVQNTTTLPPAPPKAPAPPKQINATQLIALANTRLSSFEKAVKQQYGQTMGDDAEENPQFVAGVKAFKGGDDAAAKTSLVKVPVNDPFYPAAQEILAWVFYKGKQYQQAATSYEHFASQSATAITDWRLLQFYLADYPHRKSDFWKQMDGILNPEAQHQYTKDAIELKQALEKSGVTR